MYEKFESGTDGKIYVKYLTYKFNKSLFYALCKLLTRQLVNFFVTCAAQTFLLVDCFLQFVVNNDFQRMMKCVWIITAGRHQTVSLTASQGTATSARTLRYPATPPTGSYPPSGRRSDPNFTTLRWESAVRGPRTQIRSSRFVRRSSGVLDVKMLI